MQTSAVQFLINIGGNVSQALQNITQQATQANQTLRKTTNIFSGIKGAAVGFQGVLSVMQSAGGALNGITQAGATAELQLQNMKTLFGGNAQAAQSMYERISKYGKETPYDKAGLIEAQKTMMGFGIEGEKAFETLKQIGDIAMGDSQKMQSLSLAFAQISSAGKLSGQDLMQMINAGFNPLNEISKITGKSIAKLKEEMSKGAISSEMVALAFQSATSEGGLFYNAIDQASQTTAGKLASFRDTIEEVKVAVFNATGDFGVWATAAMEIATPIAALIPLFSALFKVVKFGATAFKVLSAAMAANPIGAIIVGVTALVAAIAWVCSKITGWGSLWEGICGFMKYSFEAFVEGFKTYWTSLYQGFMIGLDKLKLGYYKFKKALGLGDEDENNAAIAQIEQEVEERERSIVEQAKKTVDAASKAVGALKNVKMGWGEEKEENGEEKTASASVLTASTATPKAEKEKLKAGEIGKTSGASAGKAEQININLKSLIENVNFHGTPKENAGEMQKQVAECLSRVLGMAQTAV